jgi:hypothetical protein
MRLFKPSMLGKAFFIVFGVAQSLHKKSKQDSSQQVNCSKLMQFASPLRNATENQGATTTGNYVTGAAEH